MTESENGQTRALDDRSLFGSLRFASSVYRTELAGRLQDFGYEIERGTPEVDSLKIAQQAVTYTRDHSFERSLSRGETVTQTYFIRDLLRPEIETEIGKTAAS